MAPSSKLLSPLALLAGTAAAVTGGQAHATPTTITPNANFATSPFNLSFDGGATTSYTFTKSGSSAQVNTYANSIKAFGSNTPRTVPFAGTDTAVTGGSAVTLIPPSGAGSDVYYGLEFTLGNAFYEGNADIQNNFTLASVTYQQVPEPASLALLATGAAGLVAVRQRRRRQASAR